jgi:PAS domain S-box-containing protein
MGELPSTFPQRTGRKSLRLVTRAVRGSKVGLWARDFSTGVITYSPEWKALLGYSDSELENTHAAWEERVHPDDRDRVVFTLNECFEGRLSGCACDGEPAYEAIYRMRHKDGSDRWILARGSCERDETGRLLRVTGSHIDVTDLKAVEQDAAIARQNADDALAVNEMMFRTVFAAASVGLAISTHDGIYLSVNPAFCRLVGCDERELVGQSWRSVVPPDGQAEIARRRREALAGLAGSGAVEKRYDTRAGFVWIRSRYCRLPAAPLQDPSLLVIAEDVTRRRESADALQRSVGQLRSLARRLQRIREDERTRVAREIHDELGQALTSMKLDAAALLTELAGLDGRVRARAAAIMDVADRSIESVRRIASDLRPGVLDDLGLVAAAEWAVEEFQARLGIPCRLLVADNVTESTSERATAMFRILQESLTNIARHARATAASVRLFNGTEGLTLQVRDNGVGFSEAELSTGQSLGILGMRERALILGGVLTIRSRPGDGTLVTVKIPAQAPATGTSR